MRVVETTLPGVFVIEPDLFPDPRGLFARTFSRDVMREHGLHDDFVQCNLSRNPKAGTLRGLHFQWAPHAEVKLVRCVQGRCFDVAVDIRPESRTFGRWVGQILDSDGAKALYVPSGFAHGYQTLTADTEVAYQTSHPYQPSHIGGVRWDDPDIAVAWPMPRPAVISDRDQSLPLLRDLGHAPG
jgi:dTDP-4-dehydrorhamnose 3,5-epimerase